MFWNPDKSLRRLEFKKPFTERYRVEQTSEITMSSLVIRTVTEWRWDVRILKTDDQYYNIELLSLDNVLLETNNPNMRDLSAFNNAFKRMYSELNVIINHQGELIRINNIETIQRKWAQVKAEMEAIQTKHDNMRGMIALNDELFNNVSNITEAVKGNEFFEIFFNVFMGVDLPGNKNLKKKSLFAQDFINWKYEINSTAHQTDELIINVIGKPNQDFDKSWLKRAYGSFPITEIANRKPQVWDQAKYKIDKSSGRLLEGRLTKEEIVHEDFLKAKMEYYIIADNPVATPQQPETKVKTDSVQPDTRSGSFIMD